MGTRLANSGFSHSLSLQLTRLRNPQDPKGNRSTRAYAQQRKQAGRQCTNPRPCNISRLLIDTPSTGPYNPARSLVRFRSQIHVVTTDESRRVFDITFIGAGPTGLFGAFYAGMRELSTKIIDVLPQPGGQLTVLYPSKIIYDTPGIPAIVADIEAEQALVNANRELIARFEKKLRVTLARVWGEDEPGPADT